MQLTQSTFMRQEMRQLLTPRMIQSMEILQLPLLALEERIEQELQANPVLELKDGADESELVEEPAGESSAQDDIADAEKALIIKEDSTQSEDFERLARISDYLENEEFYTNASHTRVPVSSYDGERDKKLDAMNNTAARGITLAEHLMGQWAFVECSPGVRQAGQAIINYIDDDGYLRTELHTIQEESKTALTMADMEAALKLVQSLEPAGVGARDPRECLLLQLDVLEDDGMGTDDHDFELERKLVSDHLKDLEMNRYPQISKKLGCSMEQVKAAVKRLSRLHPHPGRQVGGENAPAITPDAIIYFDEDGGRYEIEMAHDPSWNLSIAMKWQKFLKEKKGDKKTRQFLADNMRSARWLLDSIQQRSNTIARVIRVVVDAQRDFFDKGPEYLKPLPMIQVADQLGIHVATVSRAVSEKWIQTPRGVFPLRRFFSGGTTSAEGQDMSWDAVKEKLKAIIGNEDKSNPLDDDEIMARINQQGITLARRTVAKYRKILKIPTARQRRQY